MSAVGDWIFDGLVDRMDFVVWGVENGKVGAL